MNFIGDMSFTNELNLSLCQRQRLSLARAIYRSPDILILEDLFR